MSSRTQILALVTLVVDDCQEALHWYCYKLGFHLKADTDIGGGKRWLVVGPEQGADLLLALASDAKQEQAVGNQTGGRVGFFLHTDNFERDFAAMRGKGVVFLEEPRHEPYGIVVVFEDLYGNKWDLIEPR
ncbi:VOC family protein [Nitratireductor basaltis]|uniref:VOC domain-containing protein n=1 Tax=Nitratireductor basaltis TaxID=472175 RepID=A0A084U7C6_9HYPH|nr:VOC family protein [Nitratireductor basaltis]KFB08862.1 hypothetical protein EL18_03116 [Nitratireductor basaltis]